MKRKYPKQNRPSGHPQDETNTNGEPKVASHRKDVAAYFLGGGAAITLTIASSLFSSNQRAAIFWFWVTGVLGVTSGCFFWAAREKYAAIARVWLMGCLLVSFGCIVWAWTVQFPEAATVETEMSPATPVPLSQILPPASPTPASSSPVELKSTPKQIMDRIKGEYEWRRDKTRKAFEGMSVDWTLLFFDATRSPRLHGEDMNVSFVSREKDGFTLVFISVPVPGNEHLPIIDRLQKKFRLRGVIKSISDYGITLQSGATFDAVLEIEPSPTPKARRGLKN